MFSRTLVSFSASVFLLLNLLFGTIFFKVSKASLNFFILSLSFAFSVFLLYLLSLYFLDIFSLTLGWDLPISVFNLFCTELFLSDLDLFGKVSTISTQSILLSSPTVILLVVLALLGSTSDWNVSPRYSGCRHCCDLHRTGGNLSKAHLVASDERFCDLVGN